MRWFQHRQNVNLFVCIKLQTDSDCLNDQLATYKPFYMFIATKSRWPLYMFVATKSRWTICSVTNHQNTLHAITCLEPWHVHIRHREYWRRKCVAAMIRSLTGFRVWSVGERMGVSSRRNSKLSSSSKGIGGAGMKNRARSILALVLAEIEYV